jgi:hypothetical protein
MMSNKHQALHARRAGTRLYEDLLKARATPGKTAIERQIAETGQGNGE